MTQSQQNPFFALLAQQPYPVLSDGAMGTVLHARGVGAGICFDALNISQPELVTTVHREYVAAGSQVIQCNTFGANRYKLAHFAMEDEVVQINQAGVALARRAAQQAAAPVLVAGDVGPLGVRLAPFGRVKPEQAREAFAQQIAAQASVGIDLLIIETMSDLFEVEQAILAARETAPGVPVVASMTFTRDDLTLLGDSPAQVARALQSYGADIIGVNCSGGPHQILRILGKMRAAAPTARFSAMPNAGWPEQSGGRIMYPAGAAYIGDYALRFWEAGACLIGGCCGTTPQHITALANALRSAPTDITILDIDAETAQNAPDPTGQEPTQLAQKLANGKFVVAVEMDPPRGLSTHKLLAGASLLAESGADVINVADSPMARMRMSPWAVCSLVQRSIHIETVLHFPTRGRNLLRVQGDLLAAHALDVRNVFVVMGDPTAIGDYPNAMDNFDLVPSGLIKLIKQGFNTGIDHAGGTIGQPTSFFAGCALNLVPNDPAAEIKNLRRKIRAGADFVLTQPIYDPPAAMAFVRQAQEEIGALPPVLVGLLPLVNSRHAAFLHNEVPGITIPEPMRARIDSAADAAGEGIKIALELVEQMRPVVQGVYLMPPFNRFDTAAEIIEGIRSGQKVM